MKTNSINEAYPLRPAEAIVEIARPRSRLLETFKQSFLALAFDLGGLLAGSILITFSDILSLVPWVIIIYPSIISMRGVIGGFFSGRLSTALHLGTVKPSFLKNTGYFRVLVYSTVILTFQSSLMMGALAYFINVSFWGTGLMEALSIFSAIFTTMGLSLLFVSPVTIGISILSFKHGLDPDIMVYPVMSTLGDILVTLCFVLSLRFIFSGFLGSLITWLFDAAFLLLVIILLVKNREAEGLSRILKEFSLTLIVVALIVNVTGNLLGRIGELIGRKGEIYVLYPALIDTIGDVGSIVGSTMTTKLALGTADSSFRSIKNNLPEIGGVLISSAAWFLLFSSTSLYLVHGNIILNDLLVLAAILSSLNVLAGPIMATISYSLAVITFRNGLDPDNFVIPCESSLSDSVTTACLLLVLYIFTQANLFL
jgi:mgtE-like transporter